jgi:hypothetical protein
LSGCCEHGNEPSGFIEILEKSWNWWLLKKDSDDWPGKTEVLAEKLAPEFDFVLTNPT